MVADVIGFIGNVATEHAEGNDAARKATFRSRWSNAFAKGWRAGETAKQEGLVLPDNLAYGWDEEALGAQLAFQCTIGPTERRAKTSSKKRARQATARPRLTLVHSKT